MITSCKEDLGALASSSLDALLDIFIPKRGGQVTRKAVGSEWGQSPGGAGAGAGGTRGEWAAQGISGNPNVVVEVVERDHVIYSPTAPHSVCHDVQPWQRTRPCPRDPSGPCAPSCPAGATWYRVLTCATRQEKMMKRYEHWKRRSENVVIHRRLDCIEIRKESTKKLLGLLIEKS